MKKPKIDRYWDGWSRMRLRAEGALMALVPLRAFGVIDCSWFKVLLPLWIYLIGVAAFYLCETRDAHAKTRRKE